MKLIKKIFVFALFVFLIGFEARAQIYSCKVAGNAGVESLSFSLDKKMLTTEVVYTFNSGIKSTPEVCRVQRLDSGVVSLFCQGPSRLKEHLFTSILIQKNEVGIRFYDTQFPSLPDFGPGGPTEACEII